MQDLGEHIGLVISFSSILLVIIGFFVTGKFKKYDGYGKEIANCNKEMSSIKYNYLDRFGKVDSGIGEIREANARIEQKLDDLIKYKLQ
jgi:hypothetical protein